MLLRSKGEPEYQRMPENWTCVGTNVHSTYTANTGALLTGIHAVPHPQSPTHTSYDLPAVSRRCVTQSRLIFKSRSSMEMKKR